MYKKLALICLFTVGSLQLFAQKFDTIGMISITANKINQSINESGRSVALITAVDIANSTANTLEDLLRLEAGVNLNNRGGFGVQSDIGIRGSTFSQVLIMVDNVRLNDPLTGHFNHILPVPLQDIFSIEIIKGPAAVAYGSDAVGGLIHIKTASYMNKLSADTVSSRGQLNFGSNNYLGTDFNVVYNRKKWHLGISNQINSSNGEVFKNPNYGLNSAADSQFFTDFNLHNYSLFAGAKITNKTRFVARASYNARSFNAKYFYTASTFDESREEVNTIWSQAAFINNNTISKDGQTLNRSWELNLAFRNTKDIFDFNPLFTANEHSMNKVSVNFNKNHQINNNTTFAAGIQLENRTIESTDRGNHENLDAGLYAIVNTKALKNTSITLGNRLAYNTNFDLVYLPQFSASYSPLKNLQLNGSAGKSIRAADFTERFINFNTPTIGAGRNVGNPDLLNEESVAFDLGAKYRFRKWHQFEATYFQRQSKSVIDYVNVAGSEIENLSNVVDTNNYLYTQNIARVSTNGFEFGYNVLIPSHNRVSNFRFGVNYTYFNSYNTDNIISKYITNHPKHALNGIFRIHHNLLDLMVEGNYIQRDAAANATIAGNVLSEYFIANTKLSVLISNSAKLHIKVLNIGDVKYQEILGSPMPGRWFMGGLSWSL